MKSLLKEKKEIISITPAVKQLILPLRKNSYLFNHTDKLAADHEVTVSNTMIKVTYKKPLKDHYAPVPIKTPNSSRSPLFIENNMNSSFENLKLNNKKSKANGFDCTSANILIFPNKKESSIPKQSTNISNHSNEKQNTIQERKKEAINGINVKKIIRFKDECEAGVSSNTSKAASNTSLIEMEKLKMEQKKDCAERKLQCNSSLFLKRNNLVKVKNNISKNSLLEKKSELNQDLQKICKEESKKKIYSEILKKAKVSIEAPQKKIKKSEDNKILKRKISDDKEKAVYKSSKSNVNNKKMNSSFTVTDKVNKKPLLRVDPNLPSGWKRYIRTRNKGLPNEKHIVYIVSPQGKKFRFKWKLRRYLEKTKSNLHPDQFFFGLYKKVRPGFVAVGKSEENESAEICGFERDKSTLEELSDFENQGNTESKELLYHDPDLPFGWKRSISSNNNNEKLQVHIISPDGKIFRRKYRLIEYLEKNQYTHKLDKFYFGLYPKKDSKNETEKDESPAQLNVFPLEESAMNETCDDVSNLPEDENGNSPMYDDPNLPEGWKRFIKVRSFGESAGRMEVVIVSPDGRRHRSRRRLELYLLQKNMDYKAGDFDFTVYGKSRKRQLASISENSNSKKKFKSVLNDKPVSDLDVNNLKEMPISEEGKMINDVNSLMISCELSTARSLRRLRLPRSEHEKILRNYLHSETKMMPEDGCDIPVDWIQKLIKCRSDFKILELNAAELIAEKTKNFICEFAKRALESSQKPEEGLQYKDVADLIDKVECLFPLRTIIPKKISFKEFIKFNRPKKFLSFT